MKHFHTASRRRRGPNNMVAYPFADSSVSHTTLRRLVRNNPVPTLGDVVRGLLKKVVIQRAVEVYGAAATQPATPAIECFVEQMAQKALDDWENTLRLFYDGQGAEDFLADVQAAGDLHHD